MKIRVESLELRFTLRSDEAEYKTTWLHGGTRKYRRRRLLPREEHIFTEVAFWC